MTLGDFDKTLARRGVSEHRRRAYLRLLRSFDTWLSDRPLLDASGDDLRKFLAARRATGYAPNTLRKERHMALAFFVWAFESGLIDAHTLLSFRAVERPADASSQTQPKPYSPKELQRLRLALHERWPKLPDDEARKRVSRWREGVTPYARIRKHAIRLQLEAVVAVCLHGGLSRSEVFALHLDDVHYDNAYIVVWDGQRRSSDWREVPFTEACRERVHDWIEFRTAMRPDHDYPWLNLWAAASARQPMPRHTFDKLLANYLGPDWSFRRLRHTAGVNWLRAGMTVWELQRFLGHRALKDTLPYAEAQEVPLERRVEQLDRSLTRRLPLAA